ncbi:alpha/beta fold hydrolase [Catenuloplanes atrovinosus]|uniref:Pimeloyl-ACP methyl ester carboxylesterase n=1 Tax=Catenuloplanes atrovinosus TaxID=137266 RepID=A0AAE3YVT1_9ACTN|nr:alpha/beta hydrolase [Catenuloplanes atrovinosus]MDR7279526.1 pimeloyl-ACP methyl ester carboxylesterase [Catenuloplanes atrovinosus]
MKPALLADESALSRSEPPPPWPTRRISLGGRSVQVRETPGTSGHAEPAIYVHGLGGSAQNWTDLAGLLSARLDGFALDLPGFGYSDPVPRYSIAALAKLLVRLIEETGRGPVHLVGNSLGGVISVRAAAVRPDLIRTLTLITPAMPFLDLRRTLQAAVVPFLALPRADRLAARRFARLRPTLTRQVLNACYADPARMSEQRWREALEELEMRFTEHYASAYVGTMRALVGSFLRAYLPGANSLWRLASAVTAPTLVIGGDRDRLVDTRVPAQVARVIPDSRLMMLEGVGHVPMMEMPEAVARAILGLMDEVATPSRAG